MIGIAEQVAGREISVRGALSQNEDWLPDEMETQIYLITR